MRQDLLALTIDDLITLSNRGLVKRAQQELQLPELTGTIAEEESGKLVVQWSDDICCTFPAQTSLAQSQCSCPATSLCRHLLRSVLLYQSQAQPITTTQPTEPIAWNPGSITDEVLQQHYTKANLAKLRSQFDAGQVINVMTGIKPTVHFHSLSLNLRFLVPEDLRYTHCDCDENAPCSHVPLAIWAFRQLSSDQTHALLSTQAQPFIVPTALLEQLENHLQELADVGIVGMNAVMRDRFSRLEQQCRQAELVWIAEIILDLLQEYDYYHKHDNQFDAEKVLQCLAELWIRSDAIRNYETANHHVPQLFIRGSAQDKTVAIGSGRLVGLGCGVTERSTGATLTAYLQDLDSGTVMAMPRYFANPAAPHSPKDFWQLAQHPIAKGISLNAVGSGQLLIKGGKRTPGYQLLLGRNPASLNPQAFQWEKLRSPLRVDDFAELTDWLRELPPAELRPRRVTERLQVLAMTEVQSTEFDPVTQTVQANVTDASGNLATIVHPYSDRGQFGLETMLQKLQQPNSLKFISAQVSLSHRGLILEPIALIFQEETTRTMLQPWIAAPVVDNSTTQPDRTNSQAIPTIPQSPITNYLQELTIALQEIWLVGLDRADTNHLQQWRKIKQQGETIGFSQFMRPIEQFTSALSQKFHTLNWQRQAVREALAIVTVLNQLAISSSAAEAESINYR
jgi:hypothetical protein